MLPPARSTTLGSADTRLWGRHHIAHLMVILTDTLQTVTAPTTIRPMTLARVIDERSKATGTLAAIGHEVIADDTATRLASQAQRLLSEVESVLLATPGPSATVESLIGPVRMTDHLRATLLAMVAMGLHDGVDVPSSGSHVDDVANLLPVVDMAGALREILAED